MAGIYLHIPFCKQACHYCNFHFSTSLKYKSDVLDAILQEMDLRQDYLQGQKVETIYLGGGTPSLLTQKELNQVLEKLYQNFLVKEDAEITLEANPDDLQIEKLIAIKDTKVNRLSIGLQSFSEADLRFMNRAHSVKDAIQCLENTLSLGFNNLTIDLIYGTPTTSDKQWVKNLETVFQFGIPHISSYCLTVEPNTALDHFVKTGKTKPVDEEQAARQFEILMDQMALNGYEHYEISNFAKPGYYARHNANYWKGISYLGLGPSAHSFNGRSRQWNIAHNAKYIQAINRRDEFFEKEILDGKDQYNEYVLTSLRTSWGCELSKIKQFGQKYENHFLKNIKQFVDKQNVDFKTDSYTLTRSGKLIADRIAIELFYE